MFQDSKIAYRYIVNLEIVSVWNLESWNCQYLEILKKSKSCNLEILKLLKFRNLAILKCWKPWQPEILKFLDDTRTRVSLIGKVPCEVPTPAWDARSPTTTIATTTTSSCSNISRFQNVQELQSSEISRLSRVQEFQDFKIAYRYIVNLEIVWV